MNLFNPFTLARDLRQDRLSPATKASYLAVGVAVQYLYHAWRSASGSQATSGGVSLTLAAASVLGIYCCYRANAAGDNREFIERYICLSVPLTIWSILAGFVIGYFMLFGLHIRGAAYARMAVALSLVTWVVYFAILWRAMQIASGTPAQGVPQSQ